jgi:hypothetical protein
MICGHLQLRLQEKAGAVPKVHRKTSEKDGYAPLRGKSEHLLKDLSVWQGTAAISHRGDGYNCTTEVVCGGGKL